MSFNPGKDWTKESDELFIHKSGARIAKTTYHQKPGWFLMPPDLDQPVLEFAATDQGREQAFEAFAKGAVAKVKKKKPAKKGAPVEAAEEAEEPAAEGEAPAEAAADDEEDEDDDDEEEEPTKDAD